MRLSSSDRVSRSTTWKWIRSCKPTDFNKLQSYRNSPATLGFTAYSPRPAAALSIRFAVRLTWRKPNDATAKLSGKLKDDFGNGNTRGGLGSIWRNTRRADGQLPGTNRQARP